MKWREKKNKMNDLKLKEVMKRVLKNKRNEKIRIL